MPVFAWAEIVAAFRKFAACKMCRIVAAALIAAAAFLIWLHFHTQHAVTTAVAKVNAQATQQTVAAQAKVAEATQPIDQKYDRQAAQTSKGYIIVRQQIVAAPADQRFAPAPGIILDTLNGLDRMRPSDAPGVPETTGVGG